VSPRVITAGLAGLLAAASGCQRAERGAGEGAPATGVASQRTHQAAEVLRVPAATGPIKPDGEIDEADWPAAARAGSFVDARGEDARPASEARFLWDQDNLYVVLYAADDDLRARVTAHDGPVWLDDAFSLRLSPEPGAATFLFDISAAGVVTDARLGEGGRRDVSWESGVTLGVDRDGTLNDPRDEDEEWVIEAAIPLRSLGVTAAAGARLGVEVSRCDTPRGAGEARRCGSFGGKGRRRVLELAGR
jgi:hypothetical protein